MEIKQNKGNIFTLVLFFIAGILFLIGCTVLVGALVAALVKAFTIGYNFVNLW